MKQKKASSRSALADPSSLPAFDSKNRDIIQVIIETPKGSRNKYSFYADFKVFHLKRVLPAGMSFPYDFGFVPSTLAEDGDPLEVLVLMDEAAFPGCLLECRAIGVLEAEQSPKGREEEKERNDRIVAVERNNRSYDRVQQIGDLGNEFLHQIEKFFVNDHELAGESYRFIAIQGPDEALRLVHKAQKKTE